MAILTEELDLRNPGPIFSNNADGAHGGAISFQRMTCMAALRGAVIRVSKGPGAS